MNGVHVGAGLLGKSVGAVKGQASPQNLNPKP